MGINGAELTLPIHLNVVIFKLRDFASLYGGE